MDHSEFARRALSVVVAVVALIVSTPICLLIAIAIKITSPGPALYSQLRVGLDSRRGRGNRAAPGRRKCDLGGRPFMMHKFRTMTVDAERATGPVWAGRDDARVTRVGRFLRESRLDELPQLVNVIAGDMNIVGPRPERPPIFAELRAMIAGYCGRQRVRPGITGYAQVNFDADSTVSDVERKLRYDLEYIDHASFWMDLRIMLWTLPVLLFRKAMLLPGSNGRGPTATPLPQVAPALAFAPAEEMELTDESYALDDTRISGPVRVMTGLSEPALGYELAHEASRAEQHAGV